MTQAAARPPSPSGQDENGFEGLAEGPEGDRPMSFFEHVDELRRRLIYSAIAVTAGFVVGIAFSRELLAFLQRPLEKAWRQADLPGHPQLQVLEMEGALLVDIRVAITAGIFLAAPVLFFQLWKFVSPGLYKHEKRFVIPFVATSVVMFVAGGTFAYLVVLPFAAAWLLAYPRGGWVYSMLLDHGLLKSTSVVYQLELAKYVQGATRVLLAFGLVFEFPLLVAFLARVGLVTHRMLLDYWRIAIVVIFVIAGLLTPPEPVTQLMMGVPLTLLYFVSILVAWVLNPAGRVAPPSDLDDAGTGVADVEAQVEE